MAKEIGMAGIDISTKMITCNIACWAEDAEEIEKELNQLKYGIYHFGTSVRDLTPSEKREVIRNIPDDVFDEPKPIKFD